jgi:hypothetical protein
MELEIEFLESLVLCISSAILLGSFGLKKFEQMAKLEESC